MCRENEALEDIGLAQSVGAVHRDYSPGWSEGFEVPYDGAPVTTEVVLDPGGAIFGTVTDRFDRPIEGAIVVAVAPYNMDSECDSSHCSCPPVLLQILRHGCRQ